MVTQGNIRGGQQGVTLVELMIGAVVAAIIIAAGYAVLTSSSKALTTNEQTVETQQNVRVAMEFLFRDIRQAGFGMNGPVGNCPTAVVPADNNTAGPDRGSDRISLVVPVGNPVGTATDPPWILNSGTTMGFNLLALPSAIAVTNMASEAGGSLTVPPAVISVGGAITTTVTAAGGGNLTVTAVPAPVAFKVNTPIYLLQCITYQIIPPPDPAGLCAGRSPCLVRGVAGGMTAGVLDCTTVGSRCTSIADEIEDIQFEYGCDGCTAFNGGTPDGIIDNQGGVAGFDQADFVKDIAWGTGLMTADKIQLAQVTIVGRQRRADQGFGESNQQTAQGTALLVSDHLHSDGVFVAGDFAALTPPYTSTRRRLLTRTIELRNLRH
ncbi:MAG TPA: PilW family protein [Nitrospiraceae bacterium]|jgi:type IV pilus assembly protein PilW|nr:PilW family protein [Nitrospiraceae bacterium]